MIAANIVWDTDGNEVSLPTEIVIPDSIIKRAGYDEDKPNACNYEVIDDYLSDTTGYCVVNYDLYIA